MPLPLHYVQKTDENCLSVIASTHMDALCLHVCTRIGNATGQQQGNDIVVAESENVRLISHKPYHTDKGRRKQGALLCDAKELNAPSVYH